MGTVGQNWLVAGFGNFSSNPGETDMLLRNALTGEFEVYDIRNNAIISARSLGTVGIDWLVAGFGPKHGHYSREAKAERSRLREALLTLRDLCQPLRPSGRDYDPVGYRHGVRASELCDLQWSQIELATGRSATTAARTGAVLARLYAS